MEQSYAHATTYNCNLYAYSHVFMFPSFEYGTLLEVYIYICNTVFKR